MSGFSWRLMAGALVVVALLWLSMADLSRERVDQTDRLWGRLPSTAGMVMDGRGNFFSYDSELKTIYCLPAGGESTRFAQLAEHPACMAMGWNSALFVGSREGGVFSVDSTGKSRELARLDKSLVSIRPGRDGGVFVGLSDGQIVRLDRRALQGR